MANQQKFTEILEELQTLIARLKAGDLQLSELESLVLNARELYELSLVLRYKAYENQVQGSDVVVESPAVESKMSEIPVAEFGAVQEETVQPAIEFSLFDEPVQTPTFEKEELIEEDVFEAQQSATEQELEEESVEEPYVPVTETTIVTEEWVVEQTPVAESDEFVKRFSSIDPSLQHQLTMSRLETLIGSFGLNERLQFINELFDGSSEAFSDAIKAIDAQSDEQAALRKASNLAVQFNWDRDSETVEEFVLKIKRRYA
jgi:hypothetical protein